MAAAETGTGKTGAFALPTIQIAWEGLREGGTQYWLSFKLRIELKYCTCVDVMRPSDKGSEVAIEGPSQVRMNAEDRHSFVGLSEDGFTVQSREERSWGGTINLCCALRIQ